MVHNKHFQILLRKALHNKQLLEHKFCQELNKIINEQNNSSNNISFNNNNKRDKGNRRNGLIYNDD